MATKIPGGKPREKGDPLLRDGRGLVNLADEPTWPAAQEQSDAGDPGPQADGTGNTVSTTKPLSHARSGAADGPFRNF